MKKVIEGLRYDTATATEVASWSFGYPNDFSHSSETLYRTKSGNYFLHGEGGPASSWREQTGQREWSGGEDILAKDDLEALEWLESHGLDVPKGCPELEKLVKEA